VIIYMMQENKYRVKKNYIKEYQSFWCFNKLLLNRPILKFVAF